MSSRLRNNVGKTFINFNSNMSLVEKSQGSHADRLTPQPKFSFSSITGRYILAVVSATEEMNLADVMKF